MSTSLDHLAAEPGGQRRGVALDHQVDVGPPAAEKQIANGAADQVDRFSSRHFLHGRQLGISAVQCPAQIVDRLHGHHQCLP